MAVLVPDLLYRDNAFHAGLALELDEAAGKIVRIGTDLAAGTDDIVRLPGRALIPGFVNVHSHAFQRLIRGRTQWRPADTSIADFWTWREAMYAAALGLTPDDVYAVSHFCFIEMLRAGITSVGEFHYLHNDEHGAPYADPTELAQRVIAAAADAGIRICLLNVCYATGDVGAPLRAEQRRFATPDLDAYCAVTERLLRSHAGGALVTTGVAPHSVRAVPRAWLRPLHEFAAARDLPLHMHVSEQTGEVAACMRVHDQRPVELLHAECVLDERFTAVHATHLDDAEVQLLALSGATVCACPATERDLGDGFLRASALLAAGGSIALGSDSQTVIAPLEDARLVEYHERLQRRERVLLTDQDDGRLDVAPRLLRMATSAGARSLRLPAGTLDEGALADMVAIDLDHIALAGWTTDTLGALLLLSAPPDVVRDVWVGGRAVVTDRCHPAQHDAKLAFEHVAHRTVPKS